MEKENKLIKIVKRLVKRLGMPRWLHHLGPKTYEFWQHIFALLLKEILRLSLRRVSHILSMLGFHVPTYSTLCKMRKRIPFITWQLILKETAPQISHLVAVDSTGISRTNPSWHYIKRIGSEKPIKSYIKLSVFFDTRKKKFLGLRIRAKPRHDIKDVHYLLKKFGNMKKLLGDSAYDAESLHRLTYEKKIVLIVKPKKNAEKGVYRKKQRKEYSQRTYGRRQMIEAGFGSLKRKYGSSVLARTIAAQRAAIYLRAIAHNLELYI